MTMLSARLVAATSLERRSIHQASAFGLLILFCLSLVAEARSPDAETARIRPGHGYPGRLETYDTTPELQRQMARFDLTAGWFRRDSLPPEAEYYCNPAGCPVNELPYLLFSPKHGKKPVPMVLYFGGTGEHGTNLVDQLSSAFIQRSPIRHLRVLPEPAKPEVLTLREVVVE